MAASSLHPSTNPFRDPNRSPRLTPQPTGSSLNPFLSTEERLSPQATGSSYFTPQHTGVGAVSSQPTGIVPQPTGILNSQGSNTPNSHTTGVSPSALSDRLAGVSIAEPSHSTTPQPSLNPSASTLTPTQSIFIPPPGPPPRSYAPPSGPPPPSTNVPASTPAPERASSPVREPPPPYTAAADVQHGEIPLETGPRRAYAPEWHPDGRTWRNESALQSDSWSDESPGPSNASASAYPGARVTRPPPRHPSGSQTLGRSSTTVSRPRPGPPTEVPTPGRALLNRGRVLAYPAGYQCGRCHLTGYQAYDPSNPCTSCWSRYGQPYEGVLEFAPWDQPESVTSDEQNLQRPLPVPVSRPQTSAPRPISHPPHLVQQQSTYGGGLPPANWSSPSSLRPSATVSFSRRPPPGSLVVRPGDPRIGGRVCWKCSGEGWQYKTMGLETKTCSACNGLGRLF